MLWDAEKEESFACATVPSADISARILAYAGRYLACWLCKGPFLLIPFGDDLRRRFMNHSGLLLPCNITILKNECRCCSLTAGTEDSPSRTWRTVG